MPNSDSRGANVPDILPDPATPSRSPAMASTHISLNYHIVFATKDRQRRIETSWRSRLHEYIGGTIRGLDGHSHIVGGVEDHVHVLAGLRATRALADVVREIKKCSSLWIHEELRYPGFAWQAGYAAFTVGPRDLPSVMRYIANQEEHHRVRSFREELVDFLSRAGVEYDPRYLD
jgi:putative transposase